MKKVHHKFLRRLVLSSLGCLELLSVLHSQARGSDMAELIRQLAAHRQGRLIPDPDPLHMAIDGIGYFKVTDPITGDFLYTRKGAFTRGLQGRLQTPEGLILSPEIKLGPSVTHAAASSQSGIIWGFPGVIKSTDFDVFHKYFVQELQLVKFTHPEKLKPDVRYPGFYRATPEAGQPEEATSQWSNYGILIGNALEDYDGTWIALPESNCKREDILPKATGSPLDLALEGKGFFMMYLPATGEPLFTRQGRFEIPDSITLYLGDPGVLLTRHSYPVLTHNLLNQQEPDIYFQLQPDEKFQNIDEKGHIKILKKDREFVRSRLTIALFKDTSVLEPLGFSRQTVYRIKRQFWSDPRADYQTVFPGESGAPKLKIGHYQECEQDLIIEQAQKLSDIP